MLGQESFISLKGKRSEKLTPNPRIVTDIKILPTDKTFTHRARPAPMIKDVFHLIPRTTVYFDFNGLSRK
jgi:hypothetical protein